MEIRDSVEPASCKNMEDIRTEIDCLDHKIISLLGKRFQYVQAASKFKTSETSVRAPERFKAMLQQRRVCAVVPGRYPPDPQPGTGQSRSGALLHPGRLRRAGPVVALLSHLISPEG